MVIWDLGGQVKMRSMWEKYYAEADVVIFLLDSSDVARFDEAKIAYGNYLSIILFHIADNVVKDHIMSHTRVILVANKQDLAVCYIYCVVVYFFRMLCLHLI